MLFEFLEFEVDLEKYELRRAGKPVKLQPKVFDLLRYLIEHRDRVVGKEELLLALWRGEHVNKTAVPWAMSRARRALGQRQHATAPIETVRGRGYRFVELVHLRKVLPRTTDAPPDDVDTGDSIDARDPFVGRGPQMAR